MKDGLLIGMFEYEVPGVLFINCEKDSGNDIGGRGGGKGDGVCNNENVSDGSLSLCNCLGDFNFFRQLV